MKVLGHSNEYSVFLHGGFSPSAADLERKYAALGSHNDRDAAHPISVFTAVIYQLAESIVNKVFHFKISNVFTC